jgi:restriction endonuclease Mrr
VITLNQQQQRQLRLHLNHLKPLTRKIRGELKAELLDRLKLEAPAVFERVVIALLVQMGYGGSRAVAAEAIGKSGDEGLDGLIKEDRLGLDICISIRTGDRTSSGCGYRYFEICGRERRMSQIGPFNRCC